MNSIGNRITIVLVGWKENFVNKCSQVHDFNQVILLASFKLVELVSSIETGCTF